DEAQPVVVGHLDGLLEAQAVDPEAQALLDALDDQVRGELFHVRHEPDPGTVPWPRAGVALTARTGSTSPWWRSWASRGCRRPRTRSATSRSRRSSRRGQDRWAWADPRCSPCASA